MMQVAASPESLFPYTELLNTKHQKTGMVKSRTLH